MKKLLAACLCLGLTFSLSGCSIGELIDKYTDIHSSDKTEITETKPRVYMDELKGTLLDFTGNTLSMEANEEIYMFDVSNATLECKGGMITGDEISVIYEGQLPEEGTDTSTVKALKVVNDYHHEKKLKDQAATGKIQSVTSNTITILADSGAAVTYPISGCTEYFSSGIKKDTPVFIHYLGELGNSSGNNPNASHLKVTSISDQDPLTPPEPVKIPKDDTKTQQMTTSIQSLNLNTLNVHLDDGQTLAIDVSDIPCYFQGGAAPESRIVITYTGSFNGTTTEGISIQNIYSAASKKNKINESTVSGIITATTANTVTIQTSDGAFITCNTEDVPGYSRSRMEIGSMIRVTFDPAQNKNSNIYICIKMELI